MLVRDTAEEVGLDDVVGEGIGSDGSKVESALRRVKQTEDFNAECAGTIAPLKRWRRGGKEGGPINGGRVGKDGIDFA